MSLQSSIRMWRGHEESTEVDVIEGYKVVTVY